jgi:hypothetical protein
MTIEVEGTCVAVEDKTESDWAMDYSKELNRRVKAERRLAAVMFAVGGMITIAQRLTDHILKPFDDGDDAEVRHQMTTYKILADLGMESLDTEIIANLNTWDPPWEVFNQEYIREALAKNPEDCSSTDQRIRTEYFDWQLEFHKEAWLEARKEWELVCQQVGLQNTDETRTSRQQEFSVKVLLKTMDDQKFKAALAEEVRKSREK